MLGKEHFARFSKLLNGEIKVGDLRDAEALAFAQAIAQTGEGPEFSGDARAYLKSHLHYLQDTAAAGFSDRRASGDDLANDAFGGEDARGNSRRAAWVIQQRKKAHIPEDWEAMSTVCGQMINRTRLRILILTEHEGAGNYSDCIRKTEGGWIYVSPKYKQWLVEKGLLRPIDLAAPYVKSNEWHSASELSRSGKYVGYYATINKKFIAFREELIACLQAAGQPRESVEEWVEEHAIGTYRRGKGQAALYAHGWVIAALEKEGVLQLQANAAPYVKSNEWHSIKELRMSKKYVGYYPTINKKFIAFREELIACLQAAGEPRESAEQWVEEHAIGTYRKESGSAALFAHDWVIAALEREGVLKRRDREKDIPNEEIGALLDARDKAAAERKKPSKKV